MPYGYNKDARDSMLNDARKRMQQKKKKKKQVRYKTYNIGGAPVTLPEDASDRKRRQRREGVKSFMKAFKSVK